MNTTAQIRDLKPAFAVKADSYRSQAKEARSQAAKHREAYDKNPHGYGATSALNAQKVAIQRAAKLERLATFADASAKAAGQGVFLATLDRDLAVVQSSDPRISAARAAAYENRVVVKYDPADPRWREEGETYTPPTKAPTTLADYRAHKGLPADPAADPDLSLRPTDDNPVTPEADRIVPIGGW